ncbi:MAG: hypothetical protein V4598_00485 [Bdellovibrionota bacterium]
MKEKKSGAIRTALLVFWITTPFIFNMTSRYWFTNWLLAFFILVAFWLYDGLTLKNLFEKKWGQSQSFRI